MCYLCLLLFLKVSGAQSSSESAVTESKNEGDKFQVVVDTENTAEHDADVTEEPSLKNKEGSQNTRDANDKDLTVVKNSAQQSTVTSNDKNTTTQHDSSDKQNKNKSGATAKNVPKAAINKSKSKEEDKVDKDDKDTSVSRTESTVQGSNSTSSTSKTVTDEAVTDKVVTDKAVTDKAVTDKAVAGTMLSAGAAKSLTEAISKEKRGMKGVEQLSVVDGTKDAMVTGDSHHIGGEKEEIGQVKEVGERKGEQGEERDGHEQVDAEEEEGEDEGEDEERGGLELELGSSVDDGKYYFKNTYSETASSEGGNSDSIRSIDPHANSNKTVEPSSPTSRYVRLD